MLAKLICVSLEYLFRSGNKIPYLSKMMARNVLRRSSFSNQRSTTPFIPNTNNSCAQQFIESSASELFPFPISYNAIRIPACKRKIDEEFFNSMWYCLVAEYKCRVNLRANQLHCQSRAGSGWYSIGQHSTNSKMRDSRINYIQGCTTVKYLAINYELHFDLRGAQVHREKSLDIYLHRIWRRLKTIHQDPYTRCG